MPTPSERRLKEDISSLESVMDRVSQLEPSLYRFKDKRSGDGFSIGMIAQEVEEVFPETVIRNDNGFLSPDYGAFGVIALKAIQELSEQNAMLERKLEAQQTLIEQAMHEPVV